MSMWGFHSQISSLAMLTENRVNNVWKNKIIIYNRHIEEIINFTIIQFKFGNMIEKEFKVYKLLYDSNLSILNPIDFFIYCKCPAEVSLDGIRIRNRIFEQKIDICYLKTINAYLEK